MVEYAELHLACNTCIQSGVHHTRMLLVHTCHRARHKFLLTGTDIGEAVDVPLLAVLLFSFGERLGRGEGRFRSGGLPSLGVELLGGEGDSHQNSPPLPLSKYI